jgi:hypothetical protein
MYCLFVLYLLQTSGPSMLQIGCGTLIGKKNLNKNFTELKKKKNSMKSRSVA